MTSQMANARFARRPTFSREQRHDIAAAFLFALATVVYGLVVVQDFSGPLVGVDDINALEHLGFMLEQKMTFGLPPRVALTHTREMLYPFGTLVVFLPWGIERDLLYVVLHRTVGEGPWLQLYQTASVFVSAAGTYALLRREHGALRAFLVAFAGTFMNFYAVYKYPHHMNVSTMHWAILSIVVDFVLFRRLVLGQRWSVRLLMARAALVPLVFGLDLGYVTGFALLSLATTTGAAALVLFARRRRGEPVLPPFLPETPVAELRAHPATTALLAGLLLLGTLVYVPIVAQIVLATRTFRFEGPGGSFWAMQLRMLLPYLPFVGPPSRLVHAIFGDAEGIGEFSTGWALLVVAALGLRQARRDRTLLVYAPMLVAFALALAYHPRRFPTLRLLPWFQFNRVAGRATLVFPIWFALAGLAWRPTCDAARERVRAWIAGLGVLAAVETATAYAAFKYRPFRPDGSFWAYMKTVRESPGEAVLDWPFCISGGNGVATSDLCPYYALTSTTYAYRRFHRKDVVGLLLSRMSMSQAQPFYDLGFPSLFAPDSPEIRTARKQTRCFDDREMGLFEQFFRAHDFAGISLYPELLPDGCAERFYQRFGPPVAETRLPAEGRAVFLRRR